MTKNELWTGCVTDFRALDAGRKKSWGWEPDFRALDWGRKKSRGWEPIFRALDTCGRKRSLHNAKNKSWSGLGERKCRARPGKKDKPGPRDCFSRARPLRERKKFT